MKRTFLMLLVTGALIGLGGCAACQGRWGCEAIQGSCTKAPEYCSSCGEDCSEGCDECTAGDPNHGWRWGLLGCLCGRCDKCCGQAAGNPPTGAVTYPYYTTRGPRDYLARTPPSIGP